MIVTGSQGSTNPSEPDTRSLPRRMDLGVVLVAFVLEMFTSGAAMGPAPPAFGDGGLISPWVPGTVVVLMAGLLLVRRRRPFLVLVAVVVLSTGLIALVEPAQPLFCMLVALYTAASRGTRWQSLASLPLSLAYIGVVMWTIVDYVDPPLELSDWLFPGIFFVFLVATLWVLARRDWNHRRRAVNLGVELEVRTEEAVLAERQRIARELHDIVAHSVSAMMMQAAGARAMTRSVTRDHPEDERLHAVEGALGTIENTGAQSMRELHRLLGLLRDNPDGEAGRGSPQGPGSSTQPGLDDLEQLLEVPRQSGLIIEVHRSGSSRDVDPSVGATAYRVVQESLTNALKHAGTGALIDIYIAWQGPNLQVQIRCRAIQDARRPDTPHSGAGLRGLRERVGLVGGSFQAGASGDEFVTTAVLPVRPTAPTPAQLHDSAIWGAE